MKIDNIANISTGNLLVLQNRVYWLGFFAGVSFSGAWLSMFFALGEGEESSILLLAGVCSFSIFLIFLWMKFSVVKRIEKEVKRRCR